MLTVEEWGDAIFAHCDQNRITGAFVEGASGLARAVNGEAPSTPESR